MEGIGEGDGDWLRYHRWYYTHNLGVSVDGNTSRLIQWSGIMGMFIYEMQISLWDNQIGSPINNFTSMVVSS